MIRFLGFLLVALAVISDATAKRPNIVVILADDLGYGDLACMGATEMRTPHLDELMSRGMRFDQFYANCTVCSPTRASLMTGRYPDLAGVPGVIRQVPENSWGNLADCETLPERLRAAGYSTGMVGKWHLGFDKPDIPNARGFDHFAGFLGDMMDDYWTHLRGGVNWMRNGEETIDVEGHATDLFSQWSIDYINEQAADPSKPFFLYLAYNAPHFPIQPPEDWYQRVRQREPQLDEKRARNVAFVEHLDAGIGRVLEAIEQAGIADETLIVFSSDNGGSLPHAQSNGPLRGGKQDHWEGGIRVPTCIVWPGQIPATRSNALGMTMDLVPTLCEIGEASVEDWSLDGMSLAEVLLRGSEGNPKRTMIWVRREGNRRYQGRAYYAIRRGPWKLLQNTPFEPMVLVNLQEDPQEQNPLPATGKIANALERTLMLHLQAAGHVPWQ